MAAASVPARREKATSTEARRTVMGTERLARTSSPKARAACPSRSSRAACLRCPSTKSGASIVRSRGGPADARCRGSGFSGELGSWPSLTPPMGGPVYTLRTGGGLLPPWLPSRQKNGSGGCDETRRREEVGQVLREGRLEAHRRPP